jgi:hypothetical protein
MMARIPILQRRKRLMRSLPAGFMLAVLLGSGNVVAGGAPSADTGLTYDRTIRLGERMYREGLLPSGEPVQAIVKGDIPVEGTAFSCVSCHLRGGLGSIEGNVYTPPTNGSILFQPLKKIHKGVEIKYGEAPLRRPAYTDETLAEVIRSGIDPTGKVLNDIMPRYLLEDADIALLTSYLKSLSARFSPGVSDTSIRFATVIAEDVRAEDREAMLSALETYIAFKNNMRKNYQRTTTARDRMMAKAMSTSKEIEPRTLTLSRWVLKGPPETWGSQLEEYNRKEPPFVLLGGITGGEWEPIHRFCEENRIPCLFPNTDFPVISDSDWYTLYLSKGYFQEGEGAARYLNGKGELLQGKAIVQIVRASREGRGLADGFTRTWSALGHGAPVTITLKAGEELTRDTLLPLLAGEEPAVILLWDGPGALPALTVLAAGKNRPEMVFVSSGYLGEKMWSLPAQVRDFTYLTYPYRLPQDKPKSPMGVTINFQVADNKIAKQTYALVQVLSMAVMEIKGNYYRDTFLDVIGMSMDRVAPLYERLSFGPGQRYASKGCYIVQLTQGEKPELVKKSPWVIH